MKASDYIVSYFESLGISVIFGYQGGMITHLVDSISKSSKLRFIQTYHEQSAAIAAEGYARESGLFGVAISTSGPGATNMVTGIANAYFDSIPVVYITGQVNSYEYKYSKKIRQQGFQETDILSIVKPITKYAVMVDKVSNLQYELSKAITIATTGRKGPVLIDLPMDVQRSDIQVVSERTYQYSDTKKECTQHELCSVMAMLKQAKRPLVLCGGGIASSSSSSDINSFLQKSNLPYVVSLMGKGCVDESQQNFLGLIGSYGNRDANIVFSHADVVLVLGSRLDLRQTGNQKSDILEKIQFIHIDIDDNELNESILPNKMNISCDLSVFMKNIMREDFIFSDTKWKEYIQSIHEEYNQAKEIERFVENKVPYNYIQFIQEKADLDSIFTADIGQNQMWSAQALRLKPHQKFFTSGGLAPMGYALHAAIGVAMASPKKHIFCIIGDGGFHIALQSLMLISQYGLNIAVCVMNNEALGMITQFQELYFNSNMVGTTYDGGYCVPDIQSLANAYGLSYVKIQPEDIDNMGQLTNGIFEFSISGKTKVSPKLEFDKPLFNMSPSLPVDELSRIEEDA